MSWGVQADRTGALRNVSELRIPTGTLAPHSGGCARRQHSTARGTGEPALGGADS